VTHRRLPPSRQPVFEDDKAGLVLMALNPGAVQPRATPVFRLRRMRIALDISARLVRFGITTRAMTGGECGSHW
jgi:hypothetical protein